ncbi:copper homeostasis protein CutC [Paenibacillus anseongensis]|uniref:copper homeostasis protein CutC n=1 Tax=Paenibacillus TaxID=44249 RepID=UPI00286809C1|nr:copper homeostasis protein CutC [Paenibacillus sp. CGMCC 1.16610]
MKHVLLEVIATSVRDVIAAEQSGADRIELITGMLEGGLTPSYGLIEAAVQATKLPVQVMIRPHSYSFFYDRLDVAAMMTDIRMVKKIGAAGVVLGALTPDRRPDVEVLARLLEEAEGLSVTFHRAFDEVRDVQEALDELEKFKQIDRILTSGGKPNVLDAVQEMKHLVAWSQKTSIQILAGSGLTIASLPAFVAETGVQEVHFGKGVRMNSDPLGPIDPVRIQQMKEHRYESTKTDV